MARTVFDRRLMHCLQKGSFNSLYLIPTYAGPREVVAHNENRSNLLAAKTMVIFPRAGVKIIQERKPQNSLQSFLETLRRTDLRDLSTFFLAVDRPATYFQYPVELAENYQLELAGGIGEGEEKSSETALREAVEEYGLDESDIVQTAPLVVFPAAHDAGTNAELFTTHLMLVRNPPTPPRKEGIVPEACWQGPLLEAERYLRTQGQRGVLIEWLALATIFQLGLELHGGWNALAY